MRNKRFPKYPDDTDYNTNSPSYYDDLARKQKLIEMLSKKIWEYDDEIKEYFKRWEDNLENINEDVIEMMIQWVDDGTLDHIINDTIFNWKADKTYVDTEIERLEQKDEDLATHVDAEIERLDQEDENLTTKLTHSEQTLKNMGISVKMFDVVGDGVVNDTQNIQNAIDYCKENGFKILYFPEGEYKTEHLELSDINGLDIISLNAKINFIGTSYFFRVTGDVTDLLIEGFEFNGNDTPVEFTSAFFGGSSGHNLKRVKILNNRISNVKIGISLNANLGGSVSHCQIKHNVVENVYGEDPGSGYGLHVATHDNVNMSNTTFEWNTIINAQRHSIYIARGRGFTVRHNTILDARRGLNPLQVRSSLAIARSKDVDVEYNVLQNINGYGIALSPDADTIQSDYPIDNVKVKRNTIRNCTLSGILLNSQTVNTKNKLYNAVVEENLIEITDRHVSNHSRGITIYRGINVKIIENEIRIGNLSSDDFSVYGIYIAAITHLDEPHVDYMNNLLIKGNKLTIGRGFGIRMEGSFATNDIKTVFDSNESNVGLFMTPVQISNSQLVFINNDYSAVYFVEGVEPAYAVDYFK